MQNGQDPMAAQAVTFQGCNNELVSLIEEMKTRKLKVDNEICKLQQEKEKIAMDIKALTARLQNIDEVLKRRINAQQEYEKTIGETQAAYQRILDSSQTLVQVLRRQRDAIHTDDE